MQGLERSITTKLTKCNRHCTHHCRQYPHRHTLLQETELKLSCPAAGDYIAAIDFASYGTPTGECGSWRTGKCNAENSSAVVTAACLHKQECVIYPNTTTFGDPCFGVKKILVVTATCALGAGTATCGVVPPPPPPPPPPAYQRVTVDWAGPAHPVTTEASLQVVSHRYLARDSPIHDSSFALLKALRPRRSRYVPWCVVAVVAQGVRPFAGLFVLCSAYPCVPCMFHLSVHPIPSVVQVSHARIRLL